MVFMKYLFILLILLTGCTEVITITEVINETIYINRTVITPCNQTTIYINNTIIEPCNESIYKRDYVLGLIRQLKYYERTQDRFINHSDCFDILNNTTKELDQCKEEVCNWNSTWC